MRKLNEDDINKHDIDAVFDVASTLRDSPAGMGRFFKSFRKEKVSLEELRNAWQEAGYPDDIRDIEQILKDFKFAPKEIEKVFTEVFGKDETGEYSEPVASPVILKIAEYAKKAGIDQELIAFMQKEYPELTKSTRPGRVVSEEVRQIFTKIIKEDRPALLAYVNSKEQTLLGRTRK